MKQIDKTTTQLLQNYDLKNAEYSFKLKNKDKHVLLIKKAVFSICDELSKDQMSFIFSSFDRNNRRMEMIFKASEHDFSAKVFHEMCDGI